VQFPLQTLLVTLIVIVSVVFAAWRLSPARARLRLLDRLKPDTAHVWGRWIARLRKGVAEELMHGCSACARTSDAPALRTGRADAPRR
jgi:hypothetical protein